METLKVETLQDLGYQASGEKYLLVEGESSTITLPN